MCNYERIHYKELGLGKYPDWYYQKSHHKDTMWFKSLPSQTAQEVCKLLDKSWKSFYVLQRTKGVENPRPPRFKHNGILDGKDAKNVIEHAKSRDDECWKRLLLKGSTAVSEEAALVFASEGIYLLGNESQTVGPEDGPMAVHLILLKEEIVLLEGIRLSGVPDGKYFLNAAPINLGGADGAPCRAILISDEG